MWRMVVSAVLMMLTVATLVAYVYSQNETRKVFAAMQKLEDEKRLLKTEWVALQIEKASESRTEKVRSMAVNDLDMKLPDNEQVMVIKR